MALSAVGTGPEIQREPPAGVHGAVQAESPNRICVPGVVEKARNVSGVSAGLVVTRGGTGTPLPHHIRYSARTCTGPWNNGRHCGRTSRKKHRGPIRTHNRPLHTHRHCRNRCTARTVIARIVAGGVLYDALAFGRGFLDPRGRVGWARIGSEVGPGRGGRPPRPRAPGVRPERFRSIVVRNLARDAGAAMHTMRITASGRRIEPCPILDAIHLIVGYQPGHRMVHRDSFAFRNNLSGLFYRHDRNLRYSLFHGQILPAPPIVRRLWAAGTQ